MPLVPGSRLGVYEITAQIGEGGMGQVYRATDTSLKRQVAIKVLPEGLASDPDRLARFQREAEVLASLNHPNIAQIYGLELGANVASGFSRTLALVMELVEGEDLWQRIARLRAPGASAGQAGMPLDEVLPIAKQIAEALEAAHEQGIVHRDLKPANVKVRPDGVVKVLDFGLAKALDSAPGGRDFSPAAGLANSPTITTPAMTQMGMVMGTAAYMAPEQARGKVVDRRADIWAFGALLFEMLTGRRAFEGQDVSITLAAVMMKEPDWSALPAVTPSGLQRLIRRCLVKDPRQRMRDMGEVRLALDAGFDADDLAGGAAQALPPSAGATRPALMRRVAALVAVAVGAGALAAAAGVWFASNPTAPRVSRTTITALGPAALSLTSLGRNVAITPDGARVVYIGDQGRQIFVRALDALEPTAIVSGASLSSVCVSPDGQWVGFVDNFTRLRKVAISGGPAVTVSAVDGSPRGATWLSDDTIVFATSNSGLQRVPAGGGPLTALTTIDTARGDAGHLFPEALPGGRAVLFTITSRNGAPDASSIAVYDLETNTQTILVRGGGHAQFIPSRSASRAIRGGDGHLVFVAAGTLRAVPFDAARLAVLGSPVPVVARLVTSTAGAGHFAVATDGTLVYADMPGGVNATARGLVWVDRAGNEEPIAAPPQQFSQARSSPDGARLALVATDQESDIWVWDLRRQTLTRLTFDPAVDTYPVWTADSRRIVYASQRAGAFNIWRQAADGSGPADRLTTHDTTHAPTALSPDGTLLFHQVSPTTGRDLMGMALDGSKTITPILQTPFDERDAVVSPDGRWLAYGTDNSGQSEVYVRPFPNTSAGQWQISTTGGRSPLWSRDGQELYFFGADGALMVVTVEATATTWNAGKPVQLFEPRYDLGSGTGGRTYDLSADGKRFVMLKFAGSDGVAPDIVVVQHFNEELRRLAPVK